MKILLYNTYFRSQSEDAGDASHLATSPAKLCEALKKRGHRISVISRKIKGSSPVIESGGILIYRTWFIDLPLLRLATWFLSAFLQSFSLKQRPDVIVCWDWSTVFPAVFHAKLHGIPLICSVRNDSRGFIKTVAFNLCDYIIYSSSWVKKTVTTNTKGIVLHHGVDLRHFDYATKPFRKYSKPVIGFFGRLHKSKGVEDLLIALRSLKGSFKAAIVGDGEEKGKLLELAGNLDVEFVGFVRYQKMPEYMAAVDIIVLPSYKEGFSSVVIEAMAMKKVIVASAVGGAPEVIDNWSNGVLFRPGDERALRKILERLLADGQLRKSLGKKGYELVKKKYEWRIMVKKWEKELERTVRVSGR
ncbi:MAG: glycosyltransferase family 4 protein [Candidatus Aenigmarchaeota archaeon]|nr:glycosyltransferase family 4 protein [Candidatus Aenigmarchaeota archaeon]